jgi:hypothetical protein
VIFRLLVLHEYHTYSGIKKTFTISETQLGGAYCVDDVIFSEMCYNLEGGYNCANFLLFCHPAYSLYTQRAIFFKKITKKKCKLLIIGQYSMPRSIFSKSCPLKVPRHCRKRKFLYAYSSFFLRIPRIRGKSEF